MAVFAGEGENEGEGEGEGAGEFWERAFARSLVVMTRIPNSSHLIQATHKLRKIRTFFAAIVIRRDPSLRSGQISLQKAQLFPAKSGYYSHLSKRQMLPISLSQFSLKKAEKDLGFVGNGAPSHGQINLSLRRSLAIIRVRGARGSICDAPDWGCDENQTVSDRWDAFGVQSA